MRGRVFYFDAGAGARFFFCCGCGGTAGATRARSLTHLGGGEEGGGRGGRRVFFFAAGAGARFFFLLRARGRHAPGHLLTWGGGEEAGGRGGAFFFLLRVRGRVFFFCCGCGGAFFFLLRVRGRHAPGHSLTGAAPEKSTHSKKAPTTKKKTRVPGASGKSVFFFVAGAFFRTIALNPKP